MQTASSVRTFLDIFVIIDNHSFMPEVFTMLVNGDGSQQPQPPQSRRTSYAALPISGFPVPYGDSSQTPLSQNLQNQPIEKELFSSLQQRRVFSPTIFYLENGVMLFFRVPLSEESLEDILCNNTFGLADFLSGENAI